MNNLIKVEYLKLKTSFPFKMLILGQMGICLLFLVIGFTDKSVDTAISGYKALHINFEQVEQNCLILSIFAGTFICSDISNKLLQLSITVGNKRRDIFISKIVLFILGTSILLSIMPIIMTSAFTILNGFGKAVTLQLVFLLMKKYIVYLFLNTALASLAILIAYAFKNLIGATIGALIGTLSIAVVTQGAGLNGLKFTVFGMARTLGDLTEPVHFLLAIFSSVVYFAILIAASYFVFSKSEF